MCAAPPPFVTKTRVLVAEDDLVLRHSISEILRERGIEVTEVGTGDAALSALADQSFDLVITDVVMPSPLGVQVAAMARTAGESVPILVITASRDPEIARIAGRLDNVRMLLKPFSRTKLIHAIELLSPRVRTAIA